MLAKRRSFNPKRQTNPNFTQTQRLALAERVGYGGNPEHKRHPGDFGLLPPSVPRPDKTLCDLVGMFSHQVALDLLREGIRKGLVSAQMRGEFPQNIWAVSDRGDPREAQLENVEKGMYHGYPMPESDPFRQVVLEHWRQAL